MDFEIRKDRRPHGRRKLTAERAAYFQLMREGYSSREACRIVGVNRRIGKKWRNGIGSTAGRNEVPPARRPVAVRSGCSRYLEEADRVHIADRLGAYVASGLTHVHRALDHPRWRPLRRRARRCLRRPRAVRGHRGSRSSVVGFRTQGHARSAHSSVNGRDGPSPRARRVLARLPRLSERPGEIATLDVSCFTPRGFDGNAA